MSSQETIYVVCRSGGTGTGGHEPQRAYRSKALAEASCDPHEYVLDVELYAELDA